MSGCGNEHTHTWYPVKYYAIGSDKRTEQMMEISDWLLRGCNEDVYNMVLLIMRNKIKSPEQDHDNSVIIRTLTLLYSDEVTSARKQAFTEPFQHSIDPSFGKITTEKNLKSTQINQTIKKNKKK